MGAEDGVRLSRRQFLVLGGVGVAAVYAGTALARTPSGSAVTDIDPTGAVPTHPLRRPPFSDTFANDALPAWNVRRPVAIIGTTPFGSPLPANQVLDRTDFLRGRGMVIGLDGPLAGSTGPGLIETLDAFVFEPGSTYTLAFSVAGSHQSADRLPPSTLTAGLPGLGASKRVTRRPQDDFLDFTLNVDVPRPATSTIVFSSENAPGQAGLLLESVSLVANN